MLEKAQKERFLMLEKSLKVFEKKEQEEYKQPFEYIIEQN